MIALLASFVQHQSPPTWPGVPATPRRWPRPLAAGAIVVALFLPRDLGSAGEAALKLPLLWSADLETLLESAPTVADLDGEPGDEVVVAGREELIALDGRGHELWRWRTAGRFMTYPSVLERQDRPALVYAADSRGLLTCLDGTGKLIWQARLQGPLSWSAAAVEDLDADGSPEVVQADGRGTVWVFAARGGQELWHTAVDGAPASPAIGDVDGDGKAEIVVATARGVLAAIGSDGSVRWSRRLGAPSPSWATAAPVLFTAADGRGRIAAAASSGWLSCIDEGGNTLWRRPTSGPVASSISVGDLDLDGQADIFVVTQLGEIRRFDESGRSLWKINMQGRCLAAGAIVDIGGDGRLEYVLCTQRGRLLVLDDAGELIFDLQFDTRTINVTPTFGDVTSSSPGLEMLVTGGEAGRVFCLQTGTPRTALAPWRGYRGDARQRGAWTRTARRATARMIAENLAWDEVFAGGTIRFVIEAREGRQEPLAATAVCVRPDGERQVATARILGTHGVLHLPVGLVVPGTYRYQWCLKTASGSELASGSRELALRPFQNARALSGRALGVLAAAASTVEPRLPLAAAALRREAALLEHEREALAPLQQAAPGSDAAAQQEVLERTAALVARARRALRVAQVAGDAVELGPTASIIPFAGTVWENREVDAQLPARVESPLEIRRRVVRGEHEPVVLGLFNVTDRELAVRVHVETQAAGFNVTPRRSLSVPTSLGDRSWDPLPELDETSILAVPSLRSRELWLDVYAGTAAPGEHRIRVRLQALDGAGVLETLGAARSVAAPEALVEVTVHVLPFAMAGPGSLRLCTWAAPSGAQVEDLLAHGNNVFVTGLSKPRYDREGHLLESDYSELDAIVKRFRGADVMLLLSGIPALRSEFASASYRQELVAFLRGLVSHLASQGIDREHFALYPIDEPGGVGWQAVQRFIAFAKMVRAADPAVMIYVDGGGEVPMFQAMAPYVDIWCPAITMLPESSGVMEIVRSTGKRLWSYDCGYPYARPIGPNIKNINLVGQFRTAALFAFRHGATGIAYWCYNTGGDPWTRIKDEFPLVYPGRTRPVPSRRWEAVREGIEDFRILTALRGRLRAAGDTRLDKETHKRLQHLLEVTLPGWLDQSFQEVKLGLARSTIDASQNDAAIAKFREELLDGVAALGGVPAGGRAPGR